MGFFFSTCGEKNKNVAGVALKVTERWTFSLYIYIYIGDKACSSLNESKTLFPPFDLYTTMLINMSELSIVKGWEGRSSDKTVYNIVLLNT